MPPQENPIEPKLEAVEATPLAEEKKGKLIKYTEQYSGDIPHPKLMKEWNDVVPGSAAKIVERFVVQSDHRMELEKSVVKANNFKQYTGPVFGFLIAMTTIVGGIYTSLQGLPFLGGPLTFSGLAILVGAFIWDKTHQRPTNVKDRQFNQKRSGGEVGRNEKCPCGSGKKYKNCHGRD